MAPTDDESLQLDFVPGDFSFAETLERMDNSPFYLRDVVHCYGEGCDAIFYTDSDRFRDGVLPDWMCEDCIRRLWEQPDHLPSNVVQLPLIAPKTFTQKPYVGQLTTGEAVFILRCLTTNTRLSHHAFSLSIGILSDTTTSAKRRLMTAYLLQPVAPFSMEGLFAYEPALHPEPVKIDLHRQHLISPSFPIVQEGPGEGVVFFKLQPWMVAWYHQYGKKVVSSGDAGFQGLTYRMKKEQERKRIKRGVVKLYDSPFGIDLASDSETTSSQEIESN